jgi:hypothetical protein
MGGLTWSPVDGVGVAQSASRAEYLASQTRIAALGFRRKQV